MGTDLSRWGGGREASLNPAHQGRHCPLGWAPACPPPEESVGERWSAGLCHLGAILYLGAEVVLLLTPSHPPFYPSFLPGLSLPVLCPQNGNQENPSCCGIEGILEAYHQSLRTVQLYGPTNFAPVVTHVAR